MQILLSEAGFCLVRSRKHQIWFDGLTRLVIPGGKVIETRLSKQLKLNIRNAVAKRGQIHSGETYVQCAY